jgi:hypothetical protein
MEEGEPKASKTAWERHFHSDPKGMSAHGTFDGHVDG